VADWVSVSITAGPKSVTRTMGAANLRHGTIASANQSPLHGAVIRTNKL